MVEEGASLGGAETDLIREDPCYQTILESLQLQQEKAPSPPIQFTTPRIKHKKMKQRRGQGLSNTMRVQVEYLPLIHLQERRKLLLVC